MSDDLDTRLARASSSQDIDDLVDLGCDLADVGRQADAEVCFRRAAGLGSAAAAFNLGNALAAQQRWLEALEAYETALAGGQTDAWRNSGDVLRELGDLAGAMRAFEAAGRAGDSNGYVELAFCLHEQGESASAMTAARRAADAGNLVALGVWAGWQWNQTLDAALEPSLRAGAEHYPAARADLAELLRSTGRVDEAREVLERGAKLGESETWLPLGNLYADDFGDIESAESAYRSGIEAGDTYCHHNLGVLLLARGDVDQAEQQFRLGASSGDELAVQALRDFLG